MCVMTRQEIFRVLVTRGVTTIQSLDLHSLNKHIASELFQAVLKTFTIIPGTI